MRIGKPGTMFAFLVVLPAGTAVSGVLTWSLFANVYGGVVFVGLFVVGLGAEHSRQARLRARCAAADAAVGHYLARLQAAAREVGVDVCTPPPPEV